MIGTPAASATGEATFGYDFGGERRTFKAGGAIARVTVTTGVYWRF